MRNVHKNKIPTEVLLRELREAIKRYKGNLPAHSCCKATGRSCTTYIRRFGSWSRAKRLALKDEEQVAAATSSESADELSSLRARLAQAYTEFENYRQEQGTIKGMLRDVVEYVKRLPAPELQYQESTTEIVQSPVGLVLHNTDWHMGMVQESNEIEGFNEFSPEILRFRILHSLVPDLLKWVALHRSTYNIDTAHVLVTMDMISGDIHDELRITNAFPTPVQLVEAGYLLAAEIALLAPHFKRLYVEAPTIDNHARLTKRPQHKEGGFNTFNYPMMALVKERLREFKNVFVNIYPRAKQVIEVKGRRYLLTHGHDIKGWAGFPYYGAERMIGKESVRRMITGIGQFDRVVMGHFHAPLWHPWYWIGGSASGTDAYDHANGRYHWPCQTSWLVHPKHGEFNCTAWKLRDEEEDA